MACISDTGVSNLQPPGGQAARGKMEVAMLRVATGRGRACGHATFRSERLKTLGLSAVRLDLAALTHARAGPRSESLAKSQPFSLGSSLSHWSPWVEGPHRTESVQRMQVRNRSPSTTHSCSADPTERTRHGADDGKDEAVLWGTSHRGPHLILVTSKEGTASLLHVTYCTGLRGTT